MILVFTISVMDSIFGDHYSETGPFPLVGGPHYLEVFAAALEQLETRVENLREKAGKGL